MTAAGLELFDLQLLAFDDLCLCLVVAQHSLQLGFQLVDHVLALLDLLLTLFQLVHFDSYSLLQLGYALHRATCLRVPEIAGLSGEGQRCDARNGRHGC